MMPKIRVRPAASRNSSMPNWMPLRHCSIRYSIVWPSPRELWLSAANQAMADRPKQDGRSTRFCRFGALAPGRRSVRHFALLPVLVLIVLHNRRDGLQTVFVAVLHRLLKIEVLDRNVIGPELEVSAHRLEIRLLGGAAHVVLLAEIAVDGFHDAIEQRYGIIGLGAVERRIALVLSPIIFDEALVGLIGQIAHPLLRAGNAESEILEPRQRQRIDGEGSVERNLALEARLRVLGHELDAGAAGIKCEDGVRLCRTRLRQLGGEIELIRPARQLAADDFSFERRGHALEHVLAGGVVRADEECGLDPLLVHIEAHRLWGLVVVPGGREHVWRAQLARELRGAGVGDNCKCLGIDERLERGEQHVRPDVADDEIHFVGFDQLLGLLHSDLGLGLIVLVDHLDRQAAELTPMMVEPKLEGIAHVRADCGHRPAKRADEPDLYRLLRHSWRGSDCDECDRSQQNLLHFGSPESAPWKSAAILVDRFRSQKPARLWPFAPFIAAPCSHCSSRKLCTWLIRCIRFFSRATVWVPSPITTWRL